MFLRITGTEDSTLRTVSLPPPFNTALLPETPSKVIEAASADVILVAASVAEIQRFS